MFLSPFIVILITFFCSCASLHSDYALFVQRDGDFYLNAPQQENDKQSARISQQPHSPFQTPKGQMHQGNHSALIYQYQQKQLIAMQRKLYVERNGLDPVWACSDAHDVYKRCTVINFLNGPMGSPQHKKPLSLPPDFKDNFSGQHMSEELFSSTSYDAFSQHFESLTRGMHNASEQYAQQARKYMRLWKYYGYSFFCQFITTLPTYEDYMLEMAAQFQHDAEFLNKVYQASNAAPSHIVTTSNHILAARNRAAEQEHARSAQKIRHEQNNILKSMFTEQANTLMQSASHWKHTSPRRAEAYYHAAMHHDNISMQSFTLSPEAERILTEASLPPLLYNDCSGNALHHELMQEIIESIECLTQIHEPTIITAWWKDLRRETLKIFDSARRTARIGDCANAAQLIDFGKQLIPCVTNLSAIATELEMGCKTGATGAVHDAIHMVIHPVKTVKKFFIAAEGILEAIAPFLPPEAPDIEDFAGWDRYYQKCAATTDAWRHAAETVYTVFEKTPSEALMKQAINMLSSTMANGLAWYHIGKFANFLARCASPIIAQCTAPILNTMIARQLITHLSNARKRLRNISQKITERCNRWLEPLEEVIAEESSLILPPRHDGFIKPFASKNAVNEKLVPTTELITPFGEPITKEFLEGSHIISPHEAIPAISSPAIVHQELNIIPSTVTKTAPYLLLSEEIVHAELMATGMRLNFTEAQLLRALTLLNNPEYRMCARTFNQAIKYFQARDRAHEVIRQVYRHCESGGFNRAKGFYYELHAALKFECEEGHFIQEFSKIMPKPYDPKKMIEHDFVTDKYLGECKNIFWKKVLEMNDCKRQLDGLITQMNHLAYNAKELTKQPILLVRHSFPEELQYIKEAIINLGVELRDGYQ